MLQDWPAVHNAELAVQNVTNLARAVRTDFDLELELLELELELLDDELEELDELQHELEKQSIYTAFLVNSF